MLCLGGAAISAYRRRQRQKLVANVTGSKAADSLDGMSWQEFELLVGGAFRLEGFQVSEMGGGGADGGVDLVLRRGSEKYLVQCKQWRAFTVGVTVVRELYGVMAAKGPLSALWSRLAASPMRQQPSPVIATSNSSTGRACSDSSSRRHLPAQGMPRRPRCQQRLRPPTLSFHPYARYVQRPWCSVPQSVALLQAVRSGGVVGILLAEEPGKSAKCAMCSNY